MNPLNHSLIPVQVVITFADLVFQRQFGARDKCRASDQIHANGTYLSLSFLFINVSPMWDHLPWHERRGCASTDTSNPNLIVRLRLICELPGRRPDR